MGLYDDLQTDIAEAFDTDLADAVKVCTIKYYTGKVYSAASGGDTVGTLVEETTRGVFDNKRTMNSWDYDKIQYDYKEQTLIVLDSELSLSIDIDTYNIYVEEGTNVYRIVEFKKDPANATYLFRLIPDNV